MDRFIVRRVKEGIDVIEGRCWMLSLAKDGATVDVTKDDVEFV